MVSGMRARRVAAGSADLSGRLGRGSTRGDHQSVGHTVTRSNTPNEPELSGVQVPADTCTSMEQGVPTAHATRGYSSHVQTARVHAHVAHHTARGVRSPVLRRASRAQQQVAQRTRPPAPLQLDPTRALHHALDQLTSHTITYRRCTSSFCRHCCRRRQQRLGVSLWVGGNGCVGFG